MQISSKPPPAGITLFPEKPQLLVVLGRSDGGEPRLDIGQTGMYAASQEGG